MGAGRKLFAFLLVLLLGAAAVYVLFFHQGGQLGDGASSTGTTATTITGSSKPAGRLDVSGGPDPKATGGADPKATGGTQSQPAQPAKAPESPSVQPAQPQSKLPAEFLKHHKILEFGSAELEKIKKEMKDSAAEADKDEVGEICGVCQEEFSKDKPAVAMKCCNFSQLACEKCLAMNLAKRSECPFCRRDVMTLEPAKAQ